MVTAGFGHGLAMVWLALLSVCLGGCKGPVAPRPIPDLYPPPALEAELTVDPVLGLPMYRTRLLVLLKEGVTVAQLEEVRAAAGAGTTIAGGAPELGMILLRLPDSPDLSRVLAARDALLILPAVETAEVDSGLAPQLLPPGPIVIAQAG